VLPREEQGDVGEPDAASRSERQRTLQHFAADKAPLIAGVEAMLQPVATPKHLGRSQFEVRAGQDLDRAQVLQRAQAAGLRAVPLVLAPGECSMRGDVVDLYPMAADAAVRLEFLDRTLESILRLRPWARPTRHRARRSPRSATERARGSSGSSRAIGGAGVARPEVRLPYWRQGRLLRATGSGMPLAGVDPS
jgi:transcription-repair coupling factor (superfamily II helicase)